METSPAFSSGDDKVLLVVAADGTGASAAHPMRSFCCSAVACAGRAVQLLGRSANFISITRSLCKKSDRPRRSYCPSRQSRPSGSCVSLV